MSGAPTHASHLVLLGVPVLLLLGAAGLYLGVSEGVLALWGFGAACLLQVPPALSLHQRIRDGLGNSGLERERLTLRWVGALLRFLALGLAMAAVSALLGERSPQASLAIQGLAAFSVALLAGFWFAKVGFKDTHPTFDLDSARSLMLLELAALLLVGSLLTRWFPWGDAVSALAQAFWMYLAGHGMAKATALGTAPGCGGSCSCG